MSILADIISGSVQPYLRPVLGITTMSVSGWRLDAETHTPSLKGLLPYKQVIFTIIYDVAMDLHVQYVDYYNIIIMHVLISNRYSKSLRLSCCIMC